MVKAKPVDAFSPPIFRSGPFELASNVRSAYLSLVEATFGLRLTADQSRDLASTVYQLAAKAGYATPVELYNVISDDGRTDLLNALVPYLTNGETHFFRVAPQIEALRRVILPELLAQHRVDRKLQLWSAGCSTGEEAYTLAILLWEQVVEPDLWDIHLLASDVNEAALATAREARYNEWAFREPPIQIRQRYFTPVDKQWALSASIRRMVRFVRLNLAADEFPSPRPGGPDLDLILCRNVTIYFGTEATRRLYNRFADALIPGGWLLLGPSDPTPQHPGSYEPVHLDGAIAWRRLSLVSVSKTPDSPPSPIVSPFSSAIRHSLDVGANRGLPPPHPRSKLLPTVEPKESRNNPLSLDAVSHVRLGMEYLEAGDVNRAIDSLRRATFLDPNNALAHFGRGRACLRIGDWPGARVAFNHARRVLAAQTDGGIVPGGEGLTTIELRRAVDFQVEAFRSRRDPKPD